jgi:hypothetical protein
MGIRQELHKIADEIEELYPHHAETIHTAADAMSVEPTIAPPLSAYDVLSPGTDPKDVGSPSPMRAVVSDQEPASPIVPPAPASQPATEPAQVGTDAKPAEAQPAILSGAVVTPADTRTTTEAKPSGGKTATP